MPNVSLPLRGGMQRSLFPTVGFVSFVIDLGGLPGSISSMANGMYAHKLDAR
jgi:hypothetical protein